MSDSRIDALNGVWTTSRANELAHCLCVIPGFDHRGEPGAAMWLYEHCENYEEAEAVVLEVIGQLAEWKGGPALALSLYCHRALRRIGAAS